MVSIRLEVVRDPTLVGSREANFYDRLIGSTVPALDGRRRLLP